MTPSLDRLLKPRSVAIVGASDKPGALGTSVLRNLERAGFAGEIYLINPKREEVAGRPCLRSIDDLPDGVDAAVLAIPRAGVLDAIRSLAGRRVGAAVIFSAGFAEGGPEGLAEQREIARVALASGMVVEGPNCLGYVNFVDNAPLTFIETARAAPAAGPAIGIVSQSGAIAAVVDTSLLSRGLDLSFSISTGNEAATGVEDYVEYLVADPATAVIGMVVEQFRNPRRFLAAARAARAADTPIVLLHPGKSSAARESAATHTGAMAGDYLLMRAMVERAGILVVDTLEEFGDCLEILQRCGGLKRGGGSSGVGDSGAFNALTLDFAESVGLVLPVASDADSPALRAALPDFVPVSNPIDMTAQGLVNPAIYGRLIEASVQDGRFSSIVFAIIQTDPITCGIKFPGIIQAIGASKTRKPLICAGLDEGAPVPPEYVAALRALRVPYFPSTERAFRALAKLAAHAERDYAADDATENSPALELPTGVVPEYRAKDLLRPLGISFPSSRFVRNATEAVQAGREVGFPVVLKAQSAELSHKSDAGGVIVGVTEDALEDAYARLVGNVASSRPDVILDGVLVEAMGMRGTEMIVGARNDAEWGPVVLVGFGGVQAELLHDVRLITADLPCEGIIKELGRLKSAAVLDGYRGDPALDVEALADIVEKVGRLLKANPNIREIDLNPVVLYPKGRGAIALDALMLVDN